MTILASRNSAPMSRRSVPSSSGGVFKNASAGSVIGGAVLSVSASRRLSIRVTLGRSSSISHRRRESHCSSRICLSGMVPKCHEPAVSGSGRCAPIVWVQRRQRAQAAIPVEGQVSSVLIVIKHRRVEPIGLSAYHSAKAKSRNRRSRMPMGRRRGFQESENRGAASHGSVFATGCLCKGRAACGRFPGKAL